MVLSDFVQEVSRGKGTRVASDGMNVVCPHNPALFLFGDLLTR